MGQRPNVLVLHTDQQRFDSLGSSGNPCARTPNLDRLAQEGTCFTRHIAANTVCMPSRASLFTGLYPPAHGVWSNGIPLNRRLYANINVENVDEARVCPEPATMADLFAAAGYDTVAFGKLHLTPNLAPPSYGYPESWAVWESGALDDWHGPYYGFRHVEMTQGHGEHPCRLGHYARWLQREHPDVYQHVMANAAAAPRPVPRLRNLYASALPSELHNTQWLAERFCAYLETRSDAQPFFAFIGFPDPHHPFTPPYDVVRDFEDAPVPDPVDPQGEAVRGGPLASAGFDVSHFTPEERRMISRYTYAAIAQIDRAVGRILEGLEASGHAGDTIVVFTSDHGEFLGDHGRLYKAETAAESLLHVPFILRAPGVSRPGHVETPMSNVDVLPTLLHLAGLEVPEGLHGQDMLEVLEEGEEHVALAYCAGGDPSLINYTVYDARYRFTLYPRLGWAELYDYQEDPGECHNLAAAQPSRVAAMQRMLEEALLQHRQPIVGRVCAW